MNPTQFQEAIGAAIRIVAAARAFEDVRCGIVPTDPARIDAMRAACADYVEPDWDEDDAMRTPDRAPFQHSNRGAPRGPRFPVNFASAYWTAVRMFGELERNAASIQNEPRFAAFSASLGPTERMGGWRRDFAKFLGVPDVPTEGGSDAQE